MEAVTSSSAFANEVSAGQSTPFATPKSTVTAMSPEVLAAFDPLHKPAPPAKAPTAMKKSPSSDAIASAAPGGTEGSPAEQGAFASAVKAKVIGVLALVQATALSAADKTKETVGSYASSAKATVLAAVDAAKAKATATGAGAKALASSTIAKAKGIVGDATAKVASYASSGKERALKVAGDAKAMALSYVPAPVKARAVWAAEAASKRYADALASASAAKEKAVSIFAKTTEKALSYVPAPVKTRAAAVLDFASAKKTAVLAAAASAKETAETRAHQAVDCTKAKVSELATEAKAIAADPKYQVTAASAAGGAVTLGTAGGAVGLTAGGAIGAAIGVVPAIFTFGLSIPVGAAIGGGTGLCVGTVAGGTAGLVTGGAAGYAGYTKKDEISGGAGAAWSRLGSATDAIKAKAISSTEFVKGKAPESVVKRAGYVLESASAMKESVKARIIRADSGSTA